MAIKDVVLTFDDVPFVRGIGRALHSFLTFTDNLRHGIMNGIRNFAFLTIAVNGVAQLYNKVNRFLPEIGQTFSVVGDIIMRNLLWPLRKELVPYLQKLLDWTRDHRGMFVKWGYVLVNVFNVVKTVFMTIYNFLAKIAGSIWEIITGKVFKGAKDITEMINIILLKIASVFWYFNKVISPFLDKIWKFFSGTFGAIFDDILTLAKSFWTEFNKVAKDLGLWQKLEDLLKSIKGLMEDLKPVAEALGKILADAFGQVLKLSLDNFKKEIDNIREWIKSIKEIIDIVNDKSMLYPEKVIKVMKILDDTFSKNRKREEERGLLPNIIKGSEKFIKDKLGFDFQKTMGFIKPHELLSFANVVAGAGISALNPVFGLPLLNTGLSGVSSVPKTVGENYTKFINEANNSNSTLNDIDKKGIFTVMGEAWEQLWGRGGKNPAITNYFTVNGMNADMIADTIVRHINESMAGSGGSMKARAGQAGY